MHTDTSDTTAAIEIDPITAETIAKLIAARYDTLITAPDASRMLGLELGDVRAWDDALADMRRSRTRFHGIRLLPYGTMHDGRGERPVYLLSAVRAFIDAATPLEAEKPRAALPRMLVRVDPSDTRPWVVRRLGTTVRP